MVLADDHQLVLEGIAALLRREPGIEVVAELTDGAAALEAILRLKPAVAVLDVQMPKISGLELLRKLREAKSMTRVVLLTMHADPSYVKEALGAGALGYVIKDSVSRGLVDAVRAAASQRLYLSARVTRGALSDDAGEDRTPGPRILSARERDVLRLVTAGRSSKEIASELALSVRTVDGHRASIMDKLGVRTVPGLVKYALHHKLTDPEF